MEPRNQTRNDSSLSRPELDSYYKVKRGRPAKPVPTGEGTSSSAASARGGGRGGVRGRGARGGRAARGRGGSGSARPASAQGGTAHVMRELNFARNGAGVFIGQGTGNIYFHAPNQSTVHIVHRGNLHTHGASVSGVNQSFNTTNDQERSSTTQ